MTFISTHCYTRLLLLPLLLACIIPSTIPTTTINNNNTTSSYHQYVNTFIGSGGSGFGSGGNNPGAQVPFGALRLGPDSTSKIFNKDVVIPFDHYSGYNYEDTYIRAFSHTRLVGAGVGDFGNFGIMPLLLNNKNINVKDLTKILTTVDGHTYKFKHENETSTPGYYSVILFDKANKSRNTNRNLSPTISRKNIQVELLATSTHTGIHRYTFLNNNNRKKKLLSSHRREVEKDDDEQRMQPGFLLDICHAAMKDDSNKYCKNATLEIEYINNNKTIRIKSSMKMAGSLTERADTGGVYIYFVADIPSNNNNMKYQIWKDKKILTMDNNINPPLPILSTTSGSLGIYLYSPAASSPFINNTLEFNVAISFISINHAINNLLYLNPFYSSSASSSSLLSFPEKKDTISNIWEKKLSIVTINNITNEAAKDNILITKFYTALYHAYCVPTTFSEYDGYYIGMDNQIHQVNEVKSDKRKHAYSDMSLWDVHRTQFPWLSLSIPDVYEDVIGSLQEMARVGGDIPRWPLANVYTGCMIGSHGMVSIAEAILKNQTRCLNITFIYEKMKLAGTSSTVKHGGRIDVDNYTKYNFVSTINCVFVKWNVHGFANLALAS